MSVLDADWWRGRLAGTRVTGLTPSEVQEIARAQGAPALPAAYEGFMLAAGRGCSHVWEPDMMAYYPDVLGLRQGAEELLEEDGHPFALGSEWLVITLTGGYELNLLPLGEADPVVWNFVEGQPGPVEHGVRFSEVVLGQLPGGRFGWRWDQSGEAGPARWAVQHLVQDLRHRFRRLLEAVGVDDVAGLVEPGRLPPTGSFAAGDRYAIDGRHVRVQTWDGRRIDVEVVDGVATFGAAQVLAYALSCSPPVDVDPAELEQALQSFAAQDRLEVRGAGVYAVPAARR